MNIRKRKKQVKSKKDIILLIVENSEVAFYNRYFKEYLKKEESILIECISSGKAGKCEITNGSKMSKQINSAFKYDKYKAVFLMIDLDTKCFQIEQNHNCLVQLKNEYKSRYIIDKSFKKNFYFFVVCNEIESWFLTIKDDKANTNSSYEDHKKEMMSFFNIKSEETIVLKMIEGLNSQKYQLDFSKNTSLQHFIKKLKEYNT